MKPRTREQIEAVVRNSLPPGTPEAVVQTTTDVTFDIEQTMHDAFFGNSVAPEAQVASHVSDSLRYSLHLGPLGPAGSGGSQGLFEIDQKEYTEWKAQPNVCQHAWAAYTGLFESYRYCTKCDQKERP